MIELVIKLSEEDYKSIKDDVKKFLSMPSHKVPVLYEAVNEGTPLPKFDECYDTISRQAALKKAINVPIAEVVTEDKVIYRKIIFADDIEKLPPVTPQPKDDKNTMSEIATAFQFGMALGFAKKCDEMCKGIGDWIPVSERFPEENETVIASTKYGVYPEARYTKEYGWEWAYESGADYWKEIEYVEAWMPLPTKYEPQESKEVE